MTDTTAEYVLLIRRVKDGLLVVVALYVLLVDLVVVGLTEAPATANKWPTSFETVGTRTTEATSSMSRDLVSVASAVTLALSVFRTLRVREGTSTAEALLVADISRGNVAVSETVGDNILPA